MVQLYPSLLAANQVNLEHDIRMLEPWSAGFHIDVMDLHFVPNLAFDFDTINAIRKCTQKPLWIHLMVQAPDACIPMLNLAANDIITVHYESSSKIDLKELLSIIRSSGYYASVALNPATVIDVIKPYIDYIDQVLIMSVKPGFSGQEFIISSLDKVKQLRDLRDEHNKMFQIAMDGGINASNILDCMHSGAQAVAISSGIFKTNEPSKAIQKLWSMTHLGQDL